MSFMDHDHKESATSIDLPPLRLEKVEHAVEQCLETHVQHKRGAIIFVGSGGGKSTTYRGQQPNAEGRVDLVDADLVYRESEAHPLQPGVVPLRPLPWWEMGEKVIFEIERRCGVVNQSMVDHGLWALTTSFDPDDAYVASHLVIVMLPWEEHKRRLIEKSGGEHYDGGAKANDDGFALVKRHREWAEKVAKEKNIPVVDSIDAAIELVRSWEYAA